MDKERTVIS